jgi:hypothetical protein
MEGVRAPSITGHYRAVALELIIEPVFDNRRGGRSGPDAGFDHLRDTKTIVLTTFKRDGTPIPTPVSIAFDGSRAFFRSYHKP